MGFLAILKGITEAAQVGATIWAGVKTNEAIEEANAEGLKLAERVRSDTLKQNAISNQMALSNLALSREGMEFGQKEAALNRQERQEQTGYNRMQNAANKYADYLNMKTSLQASRLSPIFQRTR